MSTPFYDLASLVVLPSGYKNQKIYAQKPLTTDGQLTFTRASNATRVASNGLIEKVRTNFALQSQNFGNTTVWGTRNGTFTANAGTAPDGTNTAYKVTATDSDPYIYQLINTASLVTASCYIKALGSSIGKNAQIRYSGVATVNVVMTGDWQRITATGVTAGATNWGLEVPAVAAIGDEVLIWGFQAEVGDIATDYIATTSAAVSVGPVSGLPRLDYLNSTCPRLLLEPQRSNLLTYSEQFDNAAWTKVRSSITANNTTSPAGYTDADLLVADTSSNDHFILRSATASTAQSFSVFAKAGGYNYVFVGADNLSTSGVFFNLTNGTISQNTSTLTAKIEDYGGGWYRCTVSSASWPAPFALIATSANGTSLVHTGNGTSGVYIWGAQLEAGAYATSYIPTLGTSVTRVADAASKTGISSLIGQTEGTIFMDFVYNGLTATYEEYGIYASSTNRIGLYLYLEKLRGFIIASGSSAFETDMTGTLVIGQRYKVAFAYKSGDIKCYVNGVNTFSSSASFTFSASLGTYGLNTSAGTFPFHNAINQTLLFKTRLTNAQLAELTTL